MFCSCLLANRSWPEPRVVHAELQAGLVSQHVVQAGQQGDDHSQGSAVTQPGQEVRQSGASVRCAAVRGVAMNQGCAAR